MKKLLKFGIISLSVATLSGFLPVDKLDFLESSLIVYADDSDSLLEQAEPLINVSEIERGDYSSVLGTWTTEDDKTNPVTITEDGPFGSQHSLKNVATGTQKEEGNIIFGRGVNAQGQLYDWLGAKQSEIFSLRYIPQGTIANIYQFPKGDYTITAEEDLIIGYNVGAGDIIYKRAVTSSIDEESKVLTISAGEYGMGTLGDKDGYSNVTHQPVTITAKLGDTIDLNSVTEQFTTAGREIYRVSLSNSTDGSTLTLSDYQSSYVLDKQTLKYDKISIAYVSEFTPKKGTVISSSNLGGQTVKEKKLLSDYTAEQQLIARVWRQVTGGDRAYIVYRNEAGHPIYKEGVGEVFPKITYTVVEDTSKTNNPYALSREIIFSDNGDGTVILYKFTKHWHMDEKDIPQYTKDILNTAQIISLNQVPDVNELLNTLQLAADYIRFSDDQNGKDEDNSRTIPSDNKNESEQKILTVLDKKVATQKTGDSSKVVSAKALPNTSEETSFGIIIAGVGLLLASVGLVKPREL